MALRGTPQNRVFEHINGYWGTTPRLIADAIGHPESEVKEIVRMMLVAQLVEWLDGGLYLTQPGRVAAARCDRLHPNAYHGLFGHMTTGHSDQRLARMPHERDVDKLFSRLRTMGILAFPGWRSEIHYPGKTSLRPDLWAIIPISSTTGMWHPVEVERSAAADSAIDLRVGNYRIAQEEGDPWPQLWIVGKGTLSEGGEKRDELIADRYANRCGDSPMLVFPLCDALHGDLAHLERGWRAASKRVSIDYLKGRVDRPDLLVDLNSQIADGFPKPRGANTPLNGKGQGSCDA